MNGFWLNGAKLLTIVVITSFGSLLSRGVANIHMQVYALCQQKHSKKKDAFLIVTTCPGLSWISPSNGAASQQEIPRISRILPPEQGELNDKKTVDPEINPGHLPGFKRFKPPFCLLKPPFLVH